MMSSILSSPDGEQSSQGWALHVSLRIGDHLCSRAYRHEGRCTWLATTQRDDRSSGTLQFSDGTMGPDVYGGTAGVALFLAELAAVAGNDRYRDTAVAAVSHALSQSETIAPALGFGFFTGLVGVAYAAARVGHLAQRPDLRRRARQILDRLRRRARRNALLDVISGAAGAAPCLMALSKALRDSRLASMGLRLGDSVLAAARRARDGWSWGSDATGFETARNLTGFAHGAAGFGWSLFELHHHVGYERFLHGATQAFRYEDRWIRRDQDNWPDFRQIDRARGAPCRVAWCHGAPGIGLSRLRALTQQGPRYRDDVDAAVRTSIRAVRDAGTRYESDFSLCHGLAGIAEFLLAAADTLRDENARAAALELAVSRADRFAETPEAWPCGVARGSNPSLMLGLAGIGYFYLRLACATVPSVLLPGSSTAGGETAPHFGRAPKRRNPARASSTTPANSGSAPRHTAATKE